MTAHSTAVQRSILPRVLIAANDPHVAGLEEVLASEGFAVVGPTPTVETTMSLLKGQKPDLVVLDLDLSGKSATPVAEVLQDRGIPFVVTTGASATGSIESQRAPFAGVASFTKPAPAEQIIDCLNRLFYEKTLSLIRAI